ncbi:MAG: hypothetical protein ACE5EI_06350 [Thermodesulfobacteriota bacterium]
MAITLASKFLTQLKRGVNTPNVVVDLELDGGMRRFGFHGSNETPLVMYVADGTHTASGEIYAVGSDELPMVEANLKAVSSLQNKLDPKTGYSTRGRLSFVLTGKDVFSPMVRDEYLKNRRVTRRDGFISSGFTFADYAPTFTGRILDWSRRAGELTLVVADDLKDAGCRIPPDNEPGTQYIDYRNSNPVDVIKDILTARLGISASYIDTQAFDSERDEWLGGVRFDRVVTEPAPANEYLNELQAETNSFLVHDGEKITFKVFSPPRPGQSVEEWTDDRHIIGGAFRQKGGYVDNFFNRVVVYYDYDESGSDKPLNFESAVISVDAASQNPVQWDETRTRVIKSKWIRSLTASSTANISGVALYHVSVANGTGTGTLSFSSTQNTITWTPPGGAAGDAVKLSRDGKYKVTGLDRNAYVRVLVTRGALPAEDASDTVTAVGLDGKRYAAILARRLLNRYRNPVSVVAFDVDLNSVAHEGKFIKPTDLKDITTVDACEKGEGSWVKERVMVTSVRPDFSAHRVGVEAIETKMYRRFGFVAPVGLPDYPLADRTHREYAFIGAPDNTFNAGSEDGYYTW